MTAAPPPPVPVSVTVAVPAAVAVEAGPVANQVAVSLAGLPDTAVEVTSGAQLDVSIGTGLQGPPGPPGPPGPTAVSADPGNVATLGSDSLLYVASTAGFFRYIQIAPTTVWTIDHTLGFRPNVTVVDSAGQEIFPGNVDYLSDTELQLVFSAAVGGEAYLS